MGCTRTLSQLPALQPVAFASMKTWYRDYSAVDVCAAPAKTLESDLEKVNGVLFAFLQQTSAGKEGLWTDAQLDALEQAQTTLPPAVKVHARNSERALACKEFSSTETDALAVTDQARRGEELARQSQARLADAPELLKHVRAMKAIQQWKDQQRSEQESERSNWCAPKPTKDPVVYFAFEDETGVTSWMFCDGSRVEQKPNAEPTYVAAVLPPKRQAAPKAYLAAAAKFPATEIRRSPKLPGEQKDTGPVLDLNGATPEP